MYTPKMKGGLGIPNLIWYYQATEITQLAYTNIKGSTPHWVDLEAYPAQWVL